MQKLNRSTTPDSTITDDCGILYVRNEIRIPDDSDELQFRLLITAHCGAAGHWGTELTHNIVRESYTWNALNADAYALISSYVHCNMEESSENTTRPLSLTVHATKPSEVINFDYRTWAQAPQTYTTGLR